MNPYPARIEELHLHLEQRYGQRDRQATEILLACMMKGAGGKYPRIIIETDYPSLETRPAWFHFGLDMSQFTSCLAIPRIQRSQAGEEIVQRWLRDERQLPRFFADAEWRRMPTCGKGARLLAMNHSYGVLLASCLRLRVDHPKGDYVLRSYNNDRELERLTTRILEGDWRDGARVSDAVPAPFLYYCEILQKLAPLQMDWEVLAGGIAAIARNTARLYSDGREPDWRAAERLMRDAIPYTTRWILEHLEEAKGASIKAHQLFRNSGQLNDKSFVREVRRLSQAGVIRAHQRYNPKDPYGYHPYRYAFRHGDYKNLLDRELKILK